jgi:2-dehydro-3-deoxyphosphogluconate aldolase/(4S)-4-hydroxy-2-oxoglutarate aldolase
VRPEAFVAFLGRERASAILRTGVEDAAAPALDAAVRAGFRIVEFTLTTPGALERIAEFSRRDGVVVGAGTVLTVEDARAAVEHGARFLVSPVVDEAVIEEAARLGVAAMPGAHTPTEMQRAHRAGAQLQKLFPAPGLGPAYVRACLGPLPFLRIVPTNGADAGNAGAWLAAGAHALGFVAPLFDASEVESGRVDLIEARARALLDAVAS